MCTAESTYPAWLLRLFSSRKRCREIDERRCHGSASKSKTATHVLLPLLLASQRLWAANAAPSNTTASTAQALTAMSPAALLANNAFSAGSWSPCSANRSTLLATQERWLSMLMDKQVRPSRTVASIGCMEHVRRMHSSERSENTTCGA